MMMGMMMMEMKILPEIAYAEKKYQKISGMDDDDADDGNENVGYPSFLTP